MLQSSICEEKLDLDRARDNLWSYLLSFLNLNLQKLMYSFLIVERIHNGEVNNPAQIDQVGSSSVFDAFLFFDSWKNE